MTRFDYTHFQSIPIRSEDDIIAGWKGDPEQPIVSVVCTAFNHEAYIEDAIKGFLIQDTDFPFQVIIHDDASTDRTAEKIRIFQEQYPRIIKCIYQKENQYSQGISPLLYTFGLSYGKYIAICEGDDYWISEKKLQMQYEAMLERQEINICIHSAYAEADGLIRKYTPFGFVSDVTTILPAAEVIRGRGSFCATASIMIGSEFAKRLPAWLERAPVLDLFIQGLGAFDSGALYIPDVMCIYRLRTQSSFTSRMAATYISSGWLYSYEVALNNFHRETGGLYPDDIARQAAVVYYKGAISSIRFGNRTDFVERIVKSFQYYPKLNSVQLFLYKFRRFFNAVSVLYRIYKRGYSFANCIQVVERRR